MKDGVLQRVKEFISTKKMSESQFAKLIGANQKTLNQQLKGERALSLDTLLLIISSFEDLSVDWLMRGEGEMYSDLHTEKSTRIIDNETDFEFAKQEGLRLLPEVDFQFAAGQKELIGGGDHAIRYWYLPDCRDCDAVVQVVGNSMSPTFPSGCWVVLKRYPLPSNPNSIPFGSVFGVVLEDGATGDRHGYIKILRRYKDDELSKKYWIAHSINSAEFDDFDIEIKSVVSLWIVKQHIVSDML